jgi:hypothetical protein
VNVGVSDESLGRFAGDALKYRFRIFDDVTQPAAPLLDRTVRVPARPR